MAETRIIGNDGSVTFFTNHNAILNSFSLTIAQVVSDVTGFGDTWRQKRGGVKDGRGSAAGFMSYDAADTGPGIADDSASSGDGPISGDAASITLIPVTGCSWTGDAIISDVTVNSSKTGDATISFNFEFSNTITETWDESAV